LLNKIWPTKMLNAYSPVHYKVFAFILSPHLLSTTSAHPCYKQCCSEGGSYPDVWRCCWFKAYATPSRLPVMFGVFVSRIKRKSLIISLFLTWYCFYYSLMSTICMKIDPGMHMGLHLVFFGKTGVTTLVTNITSFGHRFESSLVTDTPCIWSQVWK
jgi:hypothetical protein